jgi:hypothetical protein
MTSTFKLIFLFAIISLTVSVAQAQDGALTHVFPQVVDGVANDGNAYTSRLMIANGGLYPATCQVSLFGIAPERLSGDASLIVQPSSFETITTRGEDVIVTGYTRVDCSQPVVASLTYSTPLGIATVPSSPIASLVLIPMVFNGRYRYGIAIANDNDAFQVVILLFDSGATSQVYTVPLQPRSQYVKFVDEIFDVPTAGSGILRIGAVPGGGPGNFHTTALLFDQGSFTNVVPAVIR